MYQVLIVDDEPIVKIALRSMLDWSTLGFHICATASKGRKHWKWQKNTDPISLSAI